MTKAKCKYLILLVWASYAIGQPVDSDMKLAQNSNTTECSCDPICQNLDSGFNCESTRMIPREDCPCCMVCTQLENWECDLHKPCDTELGLVCSTKEPHVCTAEYNCNTDFDCPDDRICLGTVCINPCPVFHPCSGDLIGGECITRGHRASCQCPTGTKKNAAETECIVVPDDEPDMLMTTMVPITESPAAQEEMKQEEIKKMEEKMELKIMEATASRVSIKLPSKEGGILYYKTIDETEADWQVSEIQKAHYLIGLKDLKPSLTYNLKFVDVDGKETIGTVTTKVGCMEGEMVYDINDSWNKTCETKCFCKEDGLSQCQPRCQYYPGDKQDENCIERPNPNDPECCVTYQCNEDESLNETQEKSEGGQPMLIVLSKTHESVTIAWDDFRPRTHDGEYIVEYKEMKSNDSSDSDEWMRKQSTQKDHLPSMEIDNLQPNTKYLVRVSINSENSKINDQLVTKVVEVQTKAGCVQRNTTYEVGVFYPNCDKKCICSDDGTIQCSERCTKPHVRKGSQKSNPMCEEQTSADECCVFLMCKDEQNETDANLMTGDNSNKPKLIITLQTHNSITVAWDDFRSRTSQDEYVVEYREVLESPDDSPWMKKEVQPSENETYPPFVITPLKPKTDYQIRIVIQNKNVKDDIGPMSETVLTFTKPGCLYNNDSHPIGEFFNGCEESCQCSIDGLVKCKTRCSLPYFKKGSFKSDPFCSEQDVSDECCVAVQCAGEKIQNIERIEQIEHEESMQVPEETTCVLKGNSYPAGGKFFDGCDFECTCSEQGEVKCGPRCKYPKSKQLPLDPDCEYQDNPDDECCLLKVCNSTVDGTEGSSFPTLTDGCISDNKFYNAGDNFTLGCKSRCVCLGHGDISCSPRCLPTKIMTSGDECETLPDPDDICCSITFCDKKSLDVMKANVSENSLVDDMTEKPKMTISEEITEMLGNMTDSNQEHLDTITITEEEDIEGDMHNISAILATERELLNNMTAEDKEIIMKEIEEMEQITEEARNNITEKEQMLLMNLSEMKNMTIDELENVMQNKSKMETELLMIQMKMEEEMLLRNLTEMEQEFVRKNITENKKVILDMEKEMMMSNITEFEEILLQKFKKDLEDQISNIIDSMSMKEKEMNITGELDMDMDHEETMEDNHVMTDMKKEGKTHEEHMEDKKMDSTTTENIMTIIPPLGESEKRSRSDLSTENRQDIRILTTSAIDSTTLRVKAKVSEAVIDQLLSASGSDVIISLSQDSLSWINKTISIQDIDVENMSELTFDVYDLEPNTAYQLMMEYEGIKSPIVKATLQGSTSRSSSGSQCIFNNQTYKMGEEFYNGCKEFCICGQNLQVHCAAIECPESFGLDLIDPNCLEWDHDPDYTPQPPKCCVEVKCKRRADCIYNGESFENYKEIPESITGCEKKCTCMYGNVTCTDVCPPIPATIPTDLNCPPSSVILATPPGERCCRSYQCIAFPGPPPTTGFIPNVGPPAPPQMMDHMIKNVKAIVTDAGPLKVMFETPNIYKGLPATLIVLYKEFDSNNFMWSEDTIIDNAVLPQTKWQHILSGLTPGATYEIKINLNVLGNELESDVITASVPVREITTTPLPHLEFNAELYASEVDETSAKISWKTFTDNELQYIDGVRVKYMEEGAMMPEFSRILHRTNSDIQLRDLQPGTEYTVDLIFPSPDQFSSTKATNNKPITFTTLRKEDPYNFNIEISAKKVTTQTAEIYYQGIPEPANKYVNVFRVVYLREDSKQDSNAFKVPKLGKENFIFLTDLKPDLDYDIWIEAYLSNGKTKESNVIKVRTKVGELPTPEKSEVDPSSQRELGEENYYTSFVTAVIIATLACVAFVGLIVILLRKQNHAKAHINPPKSNAAYDNPSYKVGNETHDMEMNGIKGTTNGATHMEEP